ncbi:lysophospholipase [Paenibacillus sp. IB182496]|uniref:Lysophospholipase n=1 Tax=Paenibacillus sabuli TaxID=2772509 RepID=A0A927BS34_9BACL|nr:GDSL-type esterase/lipase family protein [Paenibacillus sabuli]MBD2844504.1 lysophospholipase [Paenibacillus sabuli]
MNLDRVQFYNLGAFEEIPGIGEHGMVRVPAAIRHRLNERARFIGKESIGVEIRFVTDAPNIDLYLSAQKEHGSVSAAVRVYKGNFLVKTLELQSGATTFHRLVPPPAFEKGNEKLMRDGGYAPNVWRVICGRAPIAVHGIDTQGHDIRPPRQDELPPVNWLAYGSSITNADLDGYVHVAAAKLGVQVQNKGFSGACHIEKELVDYLLDDCASDVMTCELGVNMRGAYTPEVFEQRASYLINRLVKLKKPALIITTFPNSRTDGYALGPDEVTAKEAAFNEILIRLVRQADSPTLELMHGYDVLSEVNGLSADLLHPTAYGHAVMGMNLAARLKPFLQAHRLLPQQ